jgi:hypothetical protein
MNERKHFLTNIQEIRQCLDEGLTLRQTAERLQCSIQGLQGAVSLLQELNPKTRAQRWTVLAHNPWSNQ